MSFEHPSYLAALLLVPLAALFVYWADKQRQRALARLGNPSLLARLSESVNWRGRKWRTALWLAALTLLIISIARPQWGSETQSVDQEGLQVMVALDVSQSMLVEDVKPNRLARAKLEIQDLMQKLNGDEIGVALFSGASFVQVPLTSDYMTALSYMENAQPGVISRPGTVIGDAIRTATKAFDEKLASQKVLVVMTDGEDVETDPVAAAQEAADQGVLIYTIGFGTPDGEPVPETDQTGRVIGFKKDASGNPVISRMDEATLQKIAQVGGGKYFQATAAGTELDSLLTEIDGLQKAELQSRLAVRRIERYQLFLALALLALIAAELIPDRIERKSPVSATLVPSPRGKGIG
ncbi:MAG: VWA domain-containing protein [Anaerolineae bacterium]|nr:VWA domain-containing protein [Anaerolineae bacterium]MCB9132567.1 VWA domain-containing protein [Anaerolineales bacterium]MCB0242703.1 VWA domain-containing protein [Anaerolineae bacterium]MCB0251016.1 VWA domain-containing protein [Anaerolineae bacterium]MCB9141681.1 VWA domain-containing protein [Anaerolineales bacterium]